MRLMLNTLLLVVAVTLWGCQQEDKRVTMAEDVKSDNVVVNIVTKPVIHAFSWIIGEGVEIDKRRYLRQQRRLPAARDSGATTGRLTR